MWLPAATKQRAREAIPRSEEPVVTITRRKDGRWKVYVRNPDGSSAHTTCKTEADARDRAADFVAGVGVKSPGASPAAPQASRKSARGHPEPSPPPPPKRVSQNYIPGPGRGHHTKVSRATLALAALKKQLVLDFAEGVLTTDIKEMDELFCKALETIHRSTPSTSWSAMASAADFVIQRHHREQTLPSASKRTAQRHSAMIKHTLSDIAGPDEAKKVELLEGVLASLRPGEAQLESKQTTSRLQQNEIRAHQFIVLSLRHSLAFLKRKNIGRYNHHDRVLQQSILSASSCKLPHNTVAAAARLLGTNEQGLRDALSRWDQFEAGDRDTVYDDLEAAPHAYEYATFVREQWLARTRESERMTDELRNPKDRSDPLYYRVHFQEDRSEDLLDDIFEAGVFKYGIDDFHLSMKTLMKLKPFQVRKAGAETCVCVHHLKWAKMVQSYYKQRKALNLSKGECNCNLHFTPDEARRMLSCEKPLGEVALAHKCVKRTCTECPNMKRLEMCEREKKTAEGLKFKREKWGKGTYTRADNSTKEYYDFFIRDSDFEDLLADMHAYTPTIVSHHDLAKIQDLDWDKTQQDFPRGEFCSVQVICFVLFCDCFRLLNMCVHAGFQLGL